MSLLSFENLEVQLHDPFDIRPYIKAIMEKINWLQDRLPDTVPIVILVGENHNVSSHQVVLQAILQQLDGQDYALGYEIPRPSGRYGQIENDYSNLARSFNFSGYGKLALASFYRECIRQKKIGHPNDIAIIPDPVFQDQAFVNINDIQAHRLIFRYFPNTELPIMRAAEYAPCVEGMALSNHAIVENALEHLRVTKSKVYVQSAGSAHIVETSDLKKKETYKAKHSLSRLFSSEGCITLSVIPYTEEDNKEVRHALSETNNVIVARGLDQSIIFPASNDEERAFEEEYGSHERAYLLEMEKYSAGFYTFHR